MRRNLISGFVGDTGHLTECLDTPSRYILVHMARTSIHLDEELVQRVMVRYKLSTKREAVDYALRHLAGEPLTRGQAADLLGSIPDFSVPEDPGPHLRSAPHDPD